MAAALIIITLGAIVVNIKGWNLVSTALLISIPLTVGNGIIIPLFACRHFKIPLVEYIRYTIYGPSVCALALGTILYLGHIIFPANPFAIISFGTIVGSLVTGGLYWYFILPKGFRSKITHFVQTHMPFFKSTENHGSG